MRRKACVEKAACKALCTNQITLTATKKLCLIFCDFNYYRACTTNIGFRCRESGKNRNENQEAEEGDRRLDEKRKFRTPLHKNLQKWGEEAKPD